MRRLEREVKDYWLVRLTMLPMDDWHDEIPEDWDRNQQNDNIKVYVRYDDAVNFMEVPKTIWVMLPYEFSLVNPVMMKESKVLEDVLKEELKRLSVDRTKVFKTVELIEHLKSVGKGAFKPCVVGDKETRLGNPEYPPGYLAYREFLCEWTARGCFLSPTGRRDLTEFMDEMERKKDRAWWKDLRELMFDP